MLKSVKFIRQYVFIVSYQLQYFCFRDHPELKNATRINVDKSLPDSTDNYSLQPPVENIEIDPMILDQETNQDVENEPMILDQETNQNAQNTEEVVNFETEKEEIFITLFSSIMTSKNEHGVANIAIDEILQSIKEASQKSNALMKQMMIQAASESSKYPKTKS